MEHESGERLGSVSSEPPPALLSAESGMAVLAGKPLLASGTANMSRAFESFTWHVSSIDGALNKSREPPWLTQGVASSPKGTHSALPPMRIFNGSSLGGFMGVSLMDCQINCGLPERVLIQ